MAYWDGGSGTRDGGRILPTVNLRQMSSSHSQLSASDTEEHVIDEAESVTLNFIYDASNRQPGNEDVPDSISTSISELFNFTPDTTSPSYSVARTLAAIGEDINRNHRRKFQGMVDQLNLTDNNAYEVFANVVMGVFEDGINWGRVAVLMYIAYLIIIKVAKQKADSFPRFLKLVVSYVVRFIKEKLARWIASQGGWRAALRYSTSVSVKYISIVVGSCLAFVAVAYYFKKRG